MSKIFKYPLQVTDQQTIKMPYGAKVLCVQVQDGTPCLWALVDPTVESVDHFVNTVGTGHPTNQVAENYVGTYQLQGGALVFHVFIK